MKKELKPTLQTHSYRNGVLRLALAFPAEASQLMKTIAKLEKRLNEEIGRGGQLKKQAMELQAEVDGNWKTVYEQRVRDIEATHTRQLTGLREGYKRHLRVLWQMLEKAGECISDPSQVDDATKEQLVHAILDYRGHELAAVDPDTGEPQWRNVWPSRAGS